MYLLVSGGAIATSGANFVPICIRTSHSGVLLLSLKTRIVFREPCRRISCPNSSSRRRARCFNCTIHTHSTTRDAVSLDQRHSKSRLHIKTRPGRPASKKKSQFQPKLNCFAHELTSDVAPPRPQLPSQ